MAADLSAQDELELTIVGTLLVAPNLIGETLTQADVSDFTLLGARAIFSAIGKLFLAGSPTDQLSILLEAGEDCRGVLDLILDRHLWTSDAGMPHYLDRLRQASRLRQVNALGASLAGAQTLEAAEALTSQLNGAFAARRDARVVSLGDAAAEFTAAMGSRPKYLSWGISRLDEELFVEPGDFVVLGGYASSGKTLLSLQMALGLAETYRVGFFSLETSTRKLYDRLVANKAGVSLKHIKRRDLQTEEYNAIASAVMTMNKLPVDLIQAGGMSVSDIQALTLQKRYEVIFVDYLQLIAAPGRERYEIVTANSIGLHTLAQRHGVTVIALAQLSRPERKRDRAGRPVPPDMSSFRESGQIEQDADVAMLLYPVNPDDNYSNRILKVSKNKEGEKLALELTMNGATQTLTPVDPGRDVQRKLAESGRQARQKYRQEAMDSFRELEKDEEVPFDGSEF